MKYLYIVFLAFALVSCKKNFLDEKPDQSLLIPKKLSDFSALLDNINIFNQSPCLQFIASDNFDITDNGWKALANVQERNSYYWANDIYEVVTSVNDWDTPYKQIFYTNVVLDGLKKLDQGNNTAEHNRIRGTALFCRAFALHNLSQLFSEQYVSSKAKEQLGIPVRTSSDINIRAERGNLEETYWQITDDLKIASDLLPVDAIVKSRPTKAAAKALLARVYLSMEDYDNAFIYADQALDLNSKLIDFNLINGSVTRPMPAILPNGNDEVLYYSFLSTYGYTVSSALYVSPSLYDSYDKDDLRKTLFFTSKGTGMETFRGSYTANVRLFNGVATDELYLIKAECLARINKIEEAKKTLTFLLTKRYKTNKYTEPVTTSQDAILSLVISERRKELVGRGLRWSDLRRLNNDTTFAITIKRLLNGVGYELKPGSVKYVFPIPIAEVNINQLPQNPR